MAGIDKLIINSPFREPKYHWKANNSQSFDKVPSRRSAGYFVATPGANAHNDMGIFHELPLVNAIRPRVKAWREGGYAGVTGVTKKLLEHWNDNEVRQYPFFWCQLDAMETLIWLVEASPAERVGLDIVGDGGLWKRICTKLCTGGGKTTVMAMLIAWQVCNKATYRQDKRFSKNVFIVAPNLMVKSRLQVLKTGGSNNYYSQFNIVPVSLTDKLHQGKVLIENWHTLSWDSDEKLAGKKNVDKRGAKSDEAYTRNILGEMSKAHNILVINDEAHHAWRKNPEIKIKGVTKEDEEEATIWVSGLDRIHKTRGILTCYDFSATPFAPSGKKNAEEALFSWIVSDFGLNDGIESGLVKTPRVVVRDDVIPDTETFRSKLYHIYRDETVNADITRKGVKEEESLPDLITQAYHLLGADWRETHKLWSDVGVPPVMLTVANSVETSSRLSYAFKTKRIPIEELCEHDYLIQIDSEALEKAERGSGKAKDAADRIRKIVNTVGQTGEPGEFIRNVISVGMLTEGWDAKTVTHILGLRAFSSQLLCEQIVGRGLRRRSYEPDVKDEDGFDMFSPEYVNIFGIPFTFLPHESDDTEAAKPATPKTQIEVLKEKIEYQISWANVIRIDHVFKPILNLDYNKVETLELDASETRLRADLAPIVDGKTDIDKCTEIDLEELEKGLRMQSIIFDASARIYDQVQSEWQKEGTKLALLGQVIRLVEGFIKTGAIVINPPLFNTDPLRQRLMLMMNMNKIVQHLWNYITVTQTEKIVPILDVNKKTRSTSDMQTWFTSKPCFKTNKSHISHVVCDSAWEATESYKLEKNPNVVAWVKNDHIGFEIIYVFDGVVRKYYPDFLVKLSNDVILVLETKGQKTRQSEEKRKALEEWVEAVNGIGEYGRWCSDVSYNVADVDGIILKCIGA